MSTSVLVLTRRELEALIRSRFFSRRSNRSCSGTITNSLLSQASVIRANVNLLANSATVVYDSNVLSTEGVKEVIEDTGYGAEVVESKALVDGGELRKVGESVLKEVTEKRENQEKRVISRFAVGGMTCS